MALIIIVLFLAGFAFWPLWIIAIIALIVAICRPRQVIIADPGKPRPDGIGRFVDGALKPKPRRKPTQFELAFPGSAPAPTTPTKKPLMSPVMFWIVLVVLLGLPLTFAIEQIRR